MNATPPGTRNANDAIMAADQAAWWFGICGAESVVEFGGFDWSESKTDGSKIVQNFIQMSRATSKN